MPTNKQLRVQNCFGIYVFSVLGVFLDPFFLPVFLAICSILELEAAISTVFPTFLELEPLIFHRIRNILAEFVTLELEAAVSTVFAAFLSLNCSCNMIVCNQGSFRVGFRVSSGFCLVSSFLRVGFRVRVYLGPFQNQFRIFLGSVLGLIQAWFKIYLWLVWDLFGGGLRFVEGWFRIYLGLV